MHLQRTNGHAGRAVMSLFALALCKEAYFGASGEAPSTNLPYAGRPVTKLDPVVREVLRVGMYEIGELGLADHAIGAHVDVAKALGQPHLGSFVNGEPLHEWLYVDTSCMSRLVPSSPAIGAHAGVLRTAVRQRAAGTLYLQPEGIDNGSATANEIATWHSHPTWMVQRWLKQHGHASTIALLEHNNRCSRRCSHVVLNQALHLCCRLRAMPRSRHTIRALSHHMCAAQTACVWRAIQQQHAW